MEMGVGTTGLGDSDRRNLDFSMESAAAAPVRDEGLGGDALLGMKGRLLLLFVVVADLAGGSFSSSENTNTSSRVLKARDDVVQNCPTCSDSSSSSRLLLSPLSSSSEVSNRNLASGFNGTRAV